MEAKQKMSNGDVKKAGKLAEEAMTMSDMLEKFKSELESAGQDDNAEFNALRLCSQDPYPGDGEKAEGEEAWLQEHSYTDPAWIMERERDPTAAAMEAEVAQVLRDTGSHEKALEHFTLALELDPGVLDYWALRAQANFTLKNYREAFRDCISVHKDIRPVAMWKIGGRVLSSLGQYVLSEVWLRRASRLTEGNDYEALLLFQQTRIHRFYDPLTEGTSVQVRFTKYGRAVFCTEDVAEGQELFRDTPLVSSQTDDSAKAHPACSHCAVSLLTAEDYFGMDTFRRMNKAQKAIIKKAWPKVTAYPCPHCKREKYCSLECRTHAWRQHHCHLCPSINPPAAKLYDFCAKGTTQEKGMWNSMFSPMIMARIWANILTRVKELGVKGEPTKDQWARAKEPYRRFLGFGVSGFVKQIPKMLKIMQAIFQNTEIKYKIDELEFERRYYQVACNVQSFGPPCVTWHEFVAEFHRTARPGENHRRVAQEMRGEPKDVTFGGLYALQSSLNHSCDKNVDVMDAVVDGKPGVVIRAKQPIKKGGELYTTYIDTSMQRPQRRAWLYRAYHFWCECQRCKYEGDDCSICTQCGKKARKDSPFSVCSRCHRAWYCSPQCQKVAWKAGHKKICKAWPTN
ncbi:SET and MYND domain-containing protein 5-like isoform X1 [Branchiostoma floridae]|uniref:SET and MYND domain-containing protein 5-like isoform X1 n=1 Tax=Branchiostoma floridae TaxID=7739 RepID=A0A9J7MC21_BRAFL|nr:SET and MYND domain-containing protein 5-like isoform X1 [Branchiostoma floridae]